VSRLYDRIMRNKWTPEELKESLREATVVGLDNVARYLFTDTPQEEWNFLTDFPNVAPPFQHAFYEARKCEHIRTIKDGKEILMPWGPDRPQAWGVETISGDVNWDMVEKSTRQIWGPQNLDWKEQSKKTLERIYAQEPKWMVELYLYTEGGGFDFPYPWWSWMFLITAEGQFVRMPTAEHPSKIIKTELDSRGEEEAIWIITGPGKYTPRGLIEKVKNDTTGEFAIGVSRAFPWVMYIQFMGISMMHCRNVELVTNRPPLPLNKKNIKHHGIPLTTYKTLTIEPVKKILDTEGRQGEVGVKKALHICRGHFKTYRGRGLFGKLKGVFWWTEHHRGRKEYGEVIKGYEIKTQEESDGATGSTGSESSTQSGLTVEKGQHDAEVQHLRHEGNRNVILDGGIVHGGSSRGDIPEA